MIVNIVGQGFYSVVVSSTPACFVERLLFIYGSLNFQVSLRSNSNPVTTDVYRQPFGIRTVSKTNTQLLINGKPFYCHGVAKHEDSDVSYPMNQFTLVKLSNIMSKIVIIFLPINLNICGISINRFF